MHREFTPADQRLEDQATAQAAWAAVTEVVGTTSIAISHDLVTPHSEYAGAGGIVVGAAICIAGLYNCASAIRTHWLAEAGRR